MINETEEIYVKGIIINYYNNDYKNYICQTNNPSNSYNQNYYDLYCYFSKENIVKQNNNFVITNGVKCDIDTKSPTSTYKNNSLNCNNYNGNMTINQKEFIYSNVNGESNLIASYQKQESIEIIGIVCVAVLLISLLYRLLKNIVK